MFGGLAGSSPKLANVLKLVAGLYHQKGDLGKAIAVTERA